MCMPVAFKLAFTPIRPENAARCDRGGMLLLGVCDAVYDRRVEPRRAFPIVAPPRVPATRSGRPPQRHRAPPQPTPF